MVSVGTVRLWYDAEGWGVVDSQDTPGGCWAHWSSVRVAGHQTLRSAQTVQLTFEAVEQDGYSFRALEVWPAEHDPVPAADPEPGSPAYCSDLDITWDDEGPRGP